jgi:hypothetical protein
MVLLRLAGLGLAGVAVAWAAAPALGPTPTECFADHGFPGVTIDADGGVELPMLVWGTTNAAQAWEAQADAAVDACL